MEEQGGGGGGAAVRVLLMCDYRSLLRLITAAPCDVATTATSASSSSSSPTAAAAAATSCVDVRTERRQDHQQQQQQQQQQQIRRLTTVLRRPDDVGLVLLGPRSHRTRVEADAAAAAAGEPAGASSSSSSSNTRSVGDGGVSAPPLGLFASLTRGWSSREGGGGGRLPRWEYVNKPVHRSALLLALQDLTRARGGEKDLKKDGSSSSSNSSSCSGSGDGAGAKGDSALASAAAPAAASAAASGVTGQEGPPSKPGVVAKQQQQDASTRGRSRVLVVEDNKVNQKVMGKMLTRLGVEFDVVGNGQLAVEALRSHGDSHSPPPQQQQQQQPQEDKVSVGGGYGLVLMDCHMPVMDGFEATAAIRELEVAAAASVGAESAAASSAGSSGTGGGGGAEKQQQQARVPIIAVTASALEEELQRCRDVGMDGVLPKPVRLAGIQEVLQSYGVCN